LDEAHIRLFFISVRSPHSKLLYVGGAERLVIFPDTLDRRPADDSLFAAACGYRESRRCVGPRGLGERRKIHYNVKDFSRRAINVMTANRLARRRDKAILSEVMYLIEFVAKQP